MLLGLGFQRAKDVRRFVCPQGLRTINISNSATSFYIACFVLKDVPYRKLIDSRKCKLTGPTKTVDNGTGCICQRKPCNQRPCKYFYLDSSCQWAWRELKCMQAMAYRLKSSSSLCECESLPKLRHGTHLVWL